MGYTTVFEGTATIDPPLNPYEIAYLRRFNESRRMERRNGPYFVAGSGYRGQGLGDADVINGSRPPEGQPDLWCQWTPTDYGTEIKWDGGEKFYDADEWMAFLINHFLKPNAEVQAFLLDWPAAWPQPEEFAHFTFNHMVNGRIEAQGRDPDDRWALVVENNMVTKVPYPTVAERMAAEPSIADAVRVLREAGVTVEQYAKLTGQEY